MTERLPVCVCVWGGGGGGVSLSPRLSDDGYSCLRSVCTGLINQVRVDSPCMDETPLLAHLMLNVSGLTRQWHRNRSTESSHHLMSECNMFNRF